MKLKLTRIDTTHDFIVEGIVYGKYDTNSRLVEPSVSIIAKKLDDSELYHLEMTWNHLNSGWCVETLTVKDTDEIKSEAIKFLINKHGGSYEFVDDVIH